MRLFQKFALGLTGMLAILAGLSPPAAARHARGGSASGTSYSIEFGVNLPIAPATFSTTSAPPSPSNTNNGAYYTPTTGAQLQTDLAAAAAATGSKGDVVECTAGTTYTTTSQYTLPARSGSGTIYLISSHAPEVGGSGLPPAGTRVAMQPVLQFAPTTATTGGSLAAGTYYYVITAVNAYGENGPQIEQSVTTTGSASTVTVTWGALPSATGYRVYRGTSSGAENVYYTVSSGATGSFVDTGGASTSGSPHSQSTYLASVIANLCSLRTSEATEGGPVIGRGSAANNYRLVGLDVELVDANAGDDTNYYAVNFNNGDTSVATEAAHITIERSFIDGSPSYGVEHAVEFDGTYMEFTESYCGPHIFTVGNADTQCILAYNSTGPYKITDNVIQAAGESTLFGGADTALPNPSEPSDITETYTSFYKNFFSATGSATSSSTTLTISSLQSGYVQPGMIAEDANSCIPADDAIVAQLTGTNQGTGTYQLTSAATCSTSGTVAITGTAAGKNMVEFKTGIRVQFCNNYLWNAGTEGQARSAFVLTSRNQSGTNPWWGLSDINVCSNVFNNAQFGGTDVLTQDNNYSGNYATQPAYRLRYYNNLLITTRNDGSDSTGMMYIGGNGPTMGSIGYGYDFSFSHNTIIAIPTLGANSAIGIGDNLVRDEFSNNLFDCTQYPFENAGSPGTFAAAVAGQSTDLAFVANVVTCASDGTIPSGNYTPASKTSVDYANYGSPFSSAGYGLTTGSPYHAAGRSGAGLPYTSSGTSDGTDIGANISLLPTS